LFSFNKLKIIQSFEIPQEMFCFPFHLGEKLQNLQIESVF
jgi:hypothetical protein